MCETLPAPLADAYPNVRHIYRVLDDADAWVETTALVEETGYNRRTVQEATQDLRAMNLIETRRCPMDLRAKEHRKTDA